MKIDCLLSESDNRDVRYIDELRYSNAIKINCSSLHVII